MSISFLSMCVGYLGAALANNLVHHHFGQRGVAVIGPICALVGYLPIPFHPPYAAIPILMVLPGFGGGILDAAWNAWIGNMRSSNEILGFLHAAYGIGGMAAPLVATSMITRGGGNVYWYHYFWVMVGLAGTELIVAGLAFRHKTAAIFRSTHQPSTGQDRTTTRRVLREPLTWLLAIFLLGYVGAEVALGGWITTFMLEARDADPFDAGMATVGFWLGITVGRLVLGFVTGRIGEKGAVAGYLLAAIVLEILYWIIPNFFAATVIVAFLGFFLGPLFPGSIVAVAKLMPTDFHVSAIGFAASLGACGAAILPFAVGAIAEHHGVEVLQPIILVVLIFIMCIWLLFPGGLRKGGLEHARENNHKIGHHARILAKSVSAKIASL